jgi:VanZ family protein
MNPTTARLVLFRAMLLATVALVFHLAITREAYPGVSSVNDKLGHVLAFGLLSLLADFSFPAGRFGAGKILALLGYGVLIEIVQYFLTYR